ncbi:MAG: nitrilase-related carbon-nitrogen hydrolase [Rhodospirillaceae bacterium]|jgi:predicted amidohydrolase|nr:nitrilase-related carbon-nitrogen hydrolase [Rhodospirillaceae bacterium]|tara:strand:- start:861 stop:1916 length:1056 start_codon:yes stop_codon:yes gene_type:complete
MIEPWRVTCMQTHTHALNSCANREEAMAVVNTRLDRWEQLIRGQARNGTKLVLFPEFGLQGFPVGESADEWIEKACLDLPGPETERLQKLAQELGLFIGANGYWRDPQFKGRYFNTSFLIDTSGDIILKYRRINTAHAGSPHDFMDHYFDTVGVEGAFPVADTELGRISMMPCGEIMFPEAARMFMLRGAEVLLHPTSDFGAADNNGWQSAKTVRASENMMYLVSCNTAGILNAPYAENECQGRSKIFDYDGRVLAEAGMGECTRAATFIDVEGLRRLRSGTGGYNRLIRNRIEMYRPVYNAVSFYPPNQFADKVMDSTARIHENYQLALDNMAEHKIIPPRTKPVKEAAE